MLYLVLHSGAARFAIEAVQVAELLPLLRIEPLGARPPAVGLIRYAGLAVPVIDLGQFAGLRATPAPACLSHRLVLLREPPPGHGLLALRVEKAAETIRVEPAAFQPPPAGWEYDGRVTGVFWDKAGMLLRLDTALVMEALKPIAAGPTQTDSWTTATSKSY